MGGRVDLLGYFGWWSALILLKGLCPGSAGYGVENGWSACCSPGRDRH